MSDRYTPITDISNSTNLSATAPLVLTGDTLSIPAATSLANGHLTSADWTTFNNKYDSGDSPSFVRGTFTEAILSPFVITSNVVNTNLNADLLDGQHGSYYAAAASYLNLDQTTPQDIINGQPDFLAGLRAGSTNQLSIDVSGNFLTIGTLGVGAITGTSLKIIESGVSPSLYGIFSVPNLSSSDKTYTFPTVSGWVAYSSVGTYAGIDSYINQAVLTTSSPTFVGLTLTGLALSSGSITSTTGAISFGDENLLTTGTLGCGVITSTGSSTFGTTSEASNTLTIANSGTDVVLTSTTAALSIGAASFGAGAITGTIGRFTTGIYDNAGTPLLSANFGTRKLYAPDGTTVQIDYSLALATSIGGAGTPRAGSNFVGEFAGTVATYATSSNFFGSYAGYNAWAADASNFFGSFAGYAAIYAASSNFFGGQAGNSASAANFSNFFGGDSGKTATNASYSNFFGYRAGYLATNAKDCIFIGSYSGASDTVNNTVSGTSIAIGRYSGTGGYKDSIALGHGVINSAILQMNFGNALFLTGIYNSDTPSSTPLTASAVSIPGTLGVTGLITASSGIATPKGAITLAAGATAIAATKSFHVITGDGGGNTIATITGGSDGMILRLLFVDALVVITDTDAHTANTVDLSAAFTSADDTVLTLIYDGTSWYEVSRSVN